MTLEISPETFIFSLKAEIPGILQQITDLENRIVELPEPIIIFQPIKNLQGFFSGDTRREVVFNPNLSGLQRGNAEIQTEIRQLQQRISRINSQITLLEKDIEIKQMQSIDLQEIELIPRQNNTLRNALLIGGALLIL